MKGLLLFSALMLLIHPALAPHSDLPQGFTYEVHGDVVYLTGPFTEITSAQGNAMLRDFISSDNPVVCFRMFDTADAVSENGLILIKPWIDVCASKSVPDVPTVRG